MLLVRYSDTISLLLLMIHLNYLIKKYCIHTSRLILQYNYIYIYLLLYTLFLDSIPHSYHLCYTYLYTIHM